MRIARLQVTGASGSDSVNIAGGGFIAAVIVDYDGSDAGTDVTVSADGTAIATLTNNNTDAVRYPSVELQDATGTGRSQFASVPFFGLSMTVAQAVSGTVTVSVWYYSE